MITSWRETAKRKQMQFGRRTDMEQEEKVLKMLAECWNEFLKLEVQHPAEQREFCDAIHRCQDLIGVRVARKYRPDLFPNKGNRRKE